MSPSVQHEDSNVLNLLASPCARDLALHKRYLTVVVEVSFVLCDHLEWTVKPKQHC